MEQTINSGHQQCSAITFCFLDMGVEEEQKDWKSKINQLVSC